MMCKNDWSFEFLSEITPESFHNNEYRKYRTQIVREREESLMATTQNLVQEEIKKRNIKKEIDIILSENRILSEMVKNNEEKINNIRIDIIDKNIKEYDLYEMPLNPLKAYSIYSKKYRTKVRGKIYKENKELTKIEKNKLVTYKLSIMWKNISESRAEKYKQKEVEELYKFNDWVKRRKENKLSIIGINWKYLK
jgi:hypothetical protein